MADIIQLRRGLSSTWTSTNPVLADGELGYETNTKKGKLGDGVTAWNSLTYSWTGQVFDIDGSAEKTVPVNTDKIAISDGVLKHYTWSGLKATLKTYFDTLYGSGSGSVTSVGASVPTGFSISGSPITTSGVLAISFTAGYSLPTTANQTNWGAAYTHSQVVTGSVHGSTEVGEALLRLTNPSAIRFLRVNADNTATALTAEDFLTAIGASASSHTQNASTILAGTFATGNFAFPNNLEVNGQASSAVFAKGNSGTGTVTFSWNDSNFQTVTLNGNCTFAFANPQSGASYQIVVTNDGTVRTVTLPTVYWKGGTLPVFTGTLNAVDMITLTYDGSKYIGGYSSNHKV